MMVEEFDRFFMQMALREAEKAAADGEVPTGCVIVEPAFLDGGEEGTFDPNPATARILARAHNQPEMLRDATAHAEMLALTSAAAAKGGGEGGGHAGAWPSQEGTREGRAPARPSGRRCAATQERGPPVGEILQSPH